MGTFIAATAVRSADIDGVADAVGRFFEEFKSTGGESDDNDIRIFAPVGGWILVAWPDYLIEYAAAEYLATALSAVVSTCRIYDSDYWVHVLFAGDQLVDRYVSMPDAWSEEPDLAVEWAGDAVAVAATCECSASEIAPYLVHLTEDEDSEDEPPPVGRAFADDRFDLDDPWVFVDFWRRIGIDYPDDMAAFERRLRLAPGWLGKVPTGDIDF